MSTANSSPSALDFRYGVRVFTDANAVAEAAAAEFVELADRHISAEGAFHAVLSGGSTPRLLFRVLASDSMRSRVDWTKVHLYWGDERCVPPEHPESNFGMAQLELLSHIPTPAENVYRMNAELANLGRAAQEYEETLRRIVPLDAEGFPRFHLIFLGMGPDGHTASLFPGAAVARVTSRWVTTPFVEKFQANRMTLTLPVLNAAEEVIFLVTGAEKAEILRAVLQGTSQPPLPSQLVTVPRGRRYFFVDQAAAKLLKK